MTERSSNGQFKKGHSGNPGGRPKEFKNYLAAMGKIVRVKDWEDITLTAIARAKAGDASARQWLSDYLLGKPKQRHEVTGKDGEAIRQEHRHSGSVAVHIYLPDNGRGDGDTAPEGAAGDVSE